MRNVEPGVKGSKDQMAKFTAPIAIIKNLGYIRGMTKRNSLQEHLQRVSLSRWGAGAGAPAGELPAGSRGGAPLELVEVLAR